MDRYDFELKSLLEDAEREVPSGVWTAVSSSLDAIQREKAGHASWAWIPYSLAAAAAVLIALLLPGTWHRNSVIPEDITAQESVIEVPAEGGQDGPEPAIQFAASPAPSAKALVAHNIKAYRSDVVSEPVVPAEAQVSPAGETPSPDVAPAPVKGTPSGNVSAKPEKNSSSTSRTVSDKVEGPDPFALMEAEDNRTAARKPGLSAVISGTLIGNDAGYGRSAYGVGGQAMKGKITETSTSVYGIPVSLGIGARISLTERFSVGTGIDWSVLPRTFSGTYNGPEGSLSGEFRHVMHYIGVPANAYFTVLGTKDIRFFLSGGGEIEFCVSNRYTVSGESRRIIYSEDVKRPQFSVAGGMGVEFIINPTLCLYANPGIRYYFDSRGPKNVRTEKPMLVNFEAGLRFTL